MLLFLSTMQSLAEMHPCQTLEKRMHILGNAGTDSKPSLTLK